MGIYIFLLQHRGKLEGKQEFLTVSFFALNEAHKARAIKKIYDTYKDDYGYVQVSHMRLSNLFRFL